MRNPTIKKGVLGLVGYLDEIKESSREVTRVAIPFEDIVFFTIAPFVNQEEELETLRTNYVWFRTQCGEYYFLKKSLKELTQILPYEFVRVNDKYIVNLKAGIFNGRINGHKICVHRQEFHVTKTYAGELSKRIEQLYLV